ncbi:TetR/AcrR family transcriptional regulator [Candidatus Zixiibacteriota bacterium]
MNGQDEGKISKKQRQIVKTATDLFTRFGIKRVSVEEICQRAGASKMTFYKYFRNKLDLLRHIWREWIDEGYARLDEIDSLEIPFSEKMQKIIDYKTELVSKMSPEFIDQVLHTNPEMTAVLREIFEDSHRLFMDFVIKAQDRGDMRKMRPEFVLAVMDKLYELAHDERLRRIYPNHVEFTREINSFLFFGILRADHRGSI